MTREEKVAFLNKCCDETDCLFSDKEACPLDGSYCDAFNTLCDKDLDTAVEMFVNHLKEQGKEIPKVELPEDEGIYDAVERPQHYASTSIECIDAMRETQGVEAVKAFCVCNAFKYLWRHNSKNGDEDIKKANWYLNKAVELMEGGQHEC